MKTRVPQIRIRSLNEARVSPEGDYVVYWMTAYRRPGWNYAFQRAVEWSRELAKPLIVFEALRAGYRWASDRIHRFIIDGMVDNQASFADTPVTYYPYLEPVHGQGSGLFAAIARQACVVVGDDYPCFFLPAMLQAAAKRSPVRFEVVDGNGLLPMRAAQQTFTVAHSFRRWLQKNVRPHLDFYPVKDPIAGVTSQRAALPDEIQKRWPAADLHDVDLSRFAIDHTVKPAAIQGGSVAGQRRLRDWVRAGYDHYADHRNHPDDEASSGMSPYLHCGHVSAHEVLAAVAKADGWKRTSMTGVVHGKVEGWWGASPAFEGFMEELLVWREIGFNMCHREANYDQYDSLPQWARGTLESHRADPRPTVYDLDTLAAAQSHDRVWNAAQRELRDEGRMHNYLRMLWGKKILEWSESPRDALAAMIELNNRYALDGRDPNSYSGIFWVLGRYDRPWAPERPIFGSIRYMTSESTLRKLRMKSYLARYGGA